MDARAAPTNSTVPLTSPSTLSRARNEDTGVLRVTGRDVAEGE
jgi:hypothetical protein